MKTSQKFPKSDGKTSGTERCSVNWIKIIITSVLVFHLDWGRHLLSGDSFIIKYPYVVVGIWKMVLFIEKTLNFHNLKVNETPFQRKKSLFCGKSLRNQKWWEKQRKSGHFSKVIKITRWFITWKVNFWKVQNYQKKKNLEVTEIKWKLGKVQNTQEHWDFFTIKR